MVIGLLRRLEKCLRLPFSCGGQGSTARPGKERRVSWARPLQLQNSLKHKKLRKSAPKSESAAARGGDAALAMSHLAAVNHAAPC